MDRAAELARERKMHITVSDISKDKKNQNIVTKDKATYPVGVILMNFLKILYGELVYVLKMS
jgi:hypothetical protein